MVRCAKAYKPQHRKAVVHALEEFQDVLRSAVERGDRDIAIDCVDTMASLLQTYQTTVPPLSAQWYRMDVEIQNDPDFVSLEPLALARIDENRTWFEYKVFSLLLKAMRLCSAGLTDVANQTYIRTRELAQAQRRGSAPFELTMWAFNSYLRVNINARDLRSAFFGLNQYRKVAETFVEQRWSDEVITITYRMREYGQLAASMRMPFLLEACAYDLLQLLKKSVGEFDDVIDDILDSLLLLDQDLRTGPNEPTPAGVRRAQVQAAVVFLVNDDTARAERVIADLAGETHIDINKLILQLEQESDENYWELTPLGINFMYLAPGERSQLGAVRQRLSELRPDEKHLPSAG